MFRQFKQVAVSISKSKLLIQSPLFRQERTEAQPAQEQEGKNIHAVGLTLTNSSHLSQLQCLHL